MSKRMRNICLPLFHGKMGAKFDPTESFSCCEISEIVCEPFFNVWRGFKFFKPFFRPFSNQPKCLRFTSIWLIHIPCTQPGEFARQFWNFTNSLQKQIPAFAS